MNHACFHLLQPVRFFADVDDSFDPYVSSAKQPKGLLTAGLSLRVRALCAEMEFIFAQNFVVCLYACDASTAVEALGRDWADFFPSINFGRVLGFFIRDKNFTLNPRVAMVIARIACHDNTLPQGSPCSPVISNLIAHVLDMHLVKLASKSGRTYSRYADDLTFSTNEKGFPADIAERIGPDSHAWIPSAKLREIVKHCGFQINHQKTNMQYRDSRQVVTGLVVNRKVNIRSEYRRNVRAMVHRLLNTGSFATLDEEEGTLDQLHGMLGFIDGIDLRNKQHSGEEQEGNLSKKEQIYQRFLIYKNFFAAEFPVILCEGETDNVYLTQAIRRLVADYPDLAAIDDKGKVRIRVRLYKYRDSQHSTYSWASLWRFQSSEYFHRNLQKRNSKVHRAWPETCGGSCVR